MSAASPAIDRNAVGSPAERAWADTVALRSVSATAIRRIENSSPTR
ncbi:hypothetical protein [Methylobacterium sp. B4]|nr:hypothetical protein [Methylobacterium sp. B4]